jgi:hypothetical protein
MFGDREFRSACRNEERQKLNSSARGEEPEAGDEDQDANKTMNQNQIEAAVSGQRFGLTEGKILCGFDRMQLKNKIRQDRKGLDEKYEYGGGKTRKIKTQRRERKIDLASRHQWTELGQESNPPKQHNCEERNCAMKSSQNQIKSHSTKSLEQRQEGMKPMNNNQKFHFIRTE